MKRRIVTLLPGSATALSSARLFLAGLTAFGLAVASSAFGAGGTWNADAAGNWSDTTKWNPAAVPGTAAGDAVRLNYNLTAARIVTLDTAATVGTLTIGDPAASYFSYTLSGASTLTFDNSGGGAGLIQAITGGAADAISTAITLADNLVIDNASGLTLSGSISESGGARRLAKMGTGTLTLTGAGSYTGDTAVDMGTLDLGGSTANGSINSSSALSLGGGTLSYTRTGNNAQNFNGVSLTGGASAIKNTLATSGHTIALGSISRTAGSGGTVDFTATGNISTTSANNNGILGGWATINSIANWAVVSGGNIAAYASYTSGVPPSGTGGSANNYQGSGTVSASATGNSFFMNGDTSVGSGATLTLASGGFICNAGSGTSKWMRNNGSASTSGTGQITAGTSSSAAELFMHVYSGTDWQFWTKFVNNTAGGAVTLVKDGPGTLLLENYNTYSGGTRVNSGPLTLAAGGGTATILGNLTVNPGATVALSAVNAFGYTSTSTSVTNVNVIGGILNNATSGDQGYYTTFNLMGGTMTGGGYWVFGSAANCAINSLASSMVSTIGGNIYLKGDVVNLPITTASGMTPDGIDLAITAAISGDAGKGIVKYGAGTLRLSGANIYTGGTAVSSGTLEASGYNGLLGSSSFSATSGGILKLNGQNLFTSGHYAAIGNTRVIAADNATLLMDTSFDSRFGNVTLKNGSTWTCNRTLTGWDALLANTDTGAATVLVANTSGTAASTMNGTGGIHLQGVQNFDVAEVTGSSAADLIVNMVLDGPGAESGAAGGVNKLGLGTMTLSAANTYTGDTIISAGTLALSGSGSIAGSTNISVASGATLDVTARTDGNLTLAANQTLQGAGTVNGNLTVNGGVSPDTSADALAVTGNVTLAGVCNLRLNKGGSPSCDKLSVSGTLVLGGTLNLTITGDALAAGDSFDLFDGTLAGGFAAVIPATPGDGLHWNTSQLAPGGNGTIRVEGPCMPPTAVNASATGVKNQALIISIAGLLGLCTAPDGDPFYLSAVGPLSTNGAPVTITATNTIVYMPGFNFTGADRFSYVLTDILGCSATNQVSVTINP